MCAIGPLKTAHLLCVVAVALALSACGTGGAAEYPSDVPTNAPPTVSRVDPTSGPPGTTVTIYGFGFSIGPALNIVTIGESMAAATEYEILSSPTSDELESLTAVVPDDAVAGESPVVVLVHETPSNADVTFTVTPL